MDQSPELEALREEQRRIRLALDHLDERIAALEHRPPAASDLSFSAGLPKAEALIPQPDPQNALAEPPRMEPLSPPAPPPSPTAEKVAPEERSERPSKSLELHLGQVWLVRLGIVILLTGLVFLGNYAYHAFIDRVGPAGKLLLIYLAGGVLGGLGVWVGRKQESLKNYGRVLLSGGCATIYYATYAAHFVTPLRVIESPLLAGALLLGLGGGFVALADRVRSQTLAAATIGLSFYTSAINPVETFSLFSNLVISAAAVTLLMRRRWVSVSFLSLVGAYGSFAFWRFQQTGTLLPATSPETFWPALLFPMAYWVVHTAAVMLRRIETFDPAMRPAFLTLNNAAFFGLAGPVVAGTYPDQFWLAALIYGVGLLGLSVVASRGARDEPLFDGSYLAQGLGLVFLAALYHFTGWQKAISFALLSMTLVSLARLRHGGIYLFFAGAAALVATVAGLEGFWDGIPHARLTAGAVAAIFVGTAWLIKRRGVAPERCDWLALGMALLAAVLTVPACCDEAPFASGVRLLAVAAITMLVSRRLRLPEAAYAAQPVGLAGQALLLGDAFTHSAPWSTAMVSAVFGVALVHLWQWRDEPPLSGRRIWQPLHLIGPILTTLAWAFETLPTTSQGPTLAVMAILTLGYGGATRTGALIAASLPFALAAFFAAGVAIDDRVAWWSPAVTILLLASESLLPLWIKGIGTIDGSDFWASWWGRILRAASTLLGLGMIFAYLPQDSWFLSMTAAAGLFFAGACATFAGEAAIYAGAFLVIAMFIWLGHLWTSPAQGLDFLGFAAIACAQQIGKRRLRTTGWFGPEVQNLLGIGAIFGTWVLLHRLVVSGASGFPITVSWSLLALAVLGGGFALRERLYRQLGLIILAASVGRVFLVDIWQLDTLSRIFSLLVLGAVLLALSFLYNRYAETLKRWL